MTILSPLPLRCHAFRALASRNLASRILAFSAIAFLCHCTTPQHNHGPISSVAGGESPQATNPQAAQAKPDGRDAKAQPPRAKGGQTAFSRFPKEFTAFQRVQAISRHGAKKGYLQLKKQGGILSLVVLEPFLKSPVVSAKVTPTTETVTWLITKPRKVPKVDALLRYLYDFYAADSFAPKPKGQLRYTRGKGLPILEFKPATIGTCPFPRNINVFDGNTGKLQATVVTLRAAC